MNNQNNNPWQKADPGTQDQFIIKAQYLIDRGYSDINVYKLAETIYNKQYENQRNQSSR
jgi:hypothetical protein